MKLNLLLLLRVVAITVNLSLHCKGRCLYGTTSDCAIECHCSSVKECDRSDMTCPSGCAAGSLGYNWQGLACQIGNIAYMKKTDVYGSADSDISAKAVDGKIMSQKEDCAHVLAMASTLARWRVDLGALYSVNSIVIHNPHLPAGVGTINTYFTVGVSKDSTVINNNNVVCEHRDIATAPPRTYTINCPDSTIGRFVYYWRLDGAKFPTQAYLCEVVVIGHKYVDCSKCPSGVSCNNITGCEQCLGAYQPDCAQGCDAGAYGHNCQKTCGKCLSGQTCDKDNGRCTQGCQKWWVPDLCKIEIVKPTLESTTPTYNRGTSMSVTILWDHVNVSSDASGFYGYKIKYKKRNESTYSTEVVTIPYTTGSAKGEGTVEGLESNTWYHFVVRPYREWENVKEYGAQSEICNGKTQCSGPEKPTLVSVTRIPIVDQKQEKVDIIFQDLLMLNSGCDRITKAWIEYKLDNFYKTYAAVLNVSKLSYSFDPEYGGKYNVWLKVENNEGYTTKSNIRSVTVIGPAPPKSNNLPLEIVIPSAIAGLLIIIIIIIIVVCCNKRKHKSLDEKILPESDEDDQEIEMYTMNGQALPERAPTSKKKSMMSNGTGTHIYENYELQAMTPVLVNDFEDYVIRRVNADNFKGEFKSMPPPNHSRCLVAKFPTNIKKNRFRNIYPYDDIRVMLHTDEPMNGDYINANYITGYNGPKEYIATQGPSDVTVLDFWWMVWQEQSNRIVMVSNIYEMQRISCCQYWPVEVGASKLFGPFLVTTLNQEVCADYTTRVLQVQKKDQTLTVHQFHFTTWTDKNKPMYGATTLLAFFGKIHAFDRFGQGPIIVHCSAGVGRTGTFIALDILQYQAAKDGMVDIPTCIRDLRSDRMLMVQTWAQYIFIHITLIEFINCGDTSYDCNGFNETFTKLCTPDPQLNDMSRLERQFQLLSSMNDHSTNMKSKDGLLERNRHKNRDLEVVPDDFDRPHLSGNAANDYINAVFVDSYRSHDYYLVTQMPLPHTVPDFWKMVSNTNSHTIIMLNQFDNTDTTSKPYWPTKEKPTQTYGEIEITLKKINEGNNVDSIFTRDFLVRSIKSKASEGVLVRHFQLLTWPNTEELPTKREDLFKLFDLVNEWQNHKQTEPGNTIVHCLTGAVQSGVFCGVSHTLDRMKVELEIDAFLAVRYVTRRRPQFLETQNQYRFMYEMALEYLTLSTEQINFK